VDSYEASKAGSAGLGDWSLLVVAVVGAEAEEGKEVVGELSASAEEVVDT
jgi:hypothetical protein